MKEYGDDYARKTILEIEYLLDFNDYAEKHGDRTLVEELYFLRFKTSDLISLACELAQRIRDMHPELETGEFNNLNQCRLDMGGIIMDIQDETGVGLIEEKPYPFSPKVISTLCERAKRERTPGSPFEIPFGKDEQEPE